MLTLLYKHIVAGERAAGGPKVLRRPALRRVVLDLLAKAADAVERALASVDPAEWPQVVGMGADGSPTSRVDQVADEAVKAAVEASGVELNYLSEESPYVDRGSEWTLVVDPVDGTHNALAGIPVYSVSLAVCRQDLQGAGWGLVRDLPNGWTYAAERGRGARLNGRRIRVASYAPERSLFSLYLGQEAGPKAFELAGRCRRVRALGAASLDLCLVASGAADLYYMHSVDPRLELRISDVAAAALIVREAGGEVYDPGGSPLNMPLDPVHRSNLFALGDPALLEVVL